MEKNVLNAPTRFAGTDDEICHVGETHQRLLHSLDGYFSCLRTKRFHLTLEIVEKGKQFRDQVLAHEIYLGMSVTTKRHLMEDRSLEQQEKLDGIGDLGEDFGERNHQDQAKADRRLGCIRHFATQETIKSKEEVQMKDENLQAKIIEIKRKRKRGHSKGTIAHQTAKRQRQLDAREEVLALPAPAGRMTMLRERCIIQLKEA
jgi:hypothetical protein